jgi:hypothetical protein
MLCLLNMRLSLTWRMLNLWIWRQNFCCWLDNFWSWRLRIRWGLERKIICWLSNFIHLLLLFCRSLSFKLKSPLLHLIFKLLSLLIYHFGFFLFQSCKIIFIKNRFFVIKYVFFLKWLMLSLSLISCVSPC